MRIAIDARPLASPLTGIGRYTDSLVRRLIKTDHEWFLYSDRPLTAELPETDNVIVRCGHARGGSPGSLRWAQWEYVRWAKQDGIDVFWSPRHHLPLLLPDRIKTVVTIHDLVWKRYPETMQRKNYWLERLLMAPSIRMADNIIAVSNFTASEISHFYHEASLKVTVVLEAAEEPPVDCPLPEGIPEEFLLFVGTLEPRKNLKLLLEAYAEVCVQSPPLVIVGGAGWGELHLDKLITDNGLEQKVISLGYISEPHLQGLYGNATALVMPSLYEGFGLPLLEAMRHGVPIVTSNTGSMVEISGPAAVLIDPTSKESIATSMRQVVSDLQLRGKLSSAGLEQAAHFSWDTAAQSTLTILETA